MRILTCITTEHDLGLLVIAGLVCGLGVWASVPLYLRARNRDGGAFLAWAFLGAIAAGSSIWCTHFVAMLGYRPPAPTGYDPTLTALSLVIIIASSFVAFTVGALRFRHAPEVAGALFGLGVAVMHYTGMAAYLVDAVVDWNLGYVASSVMLSVSLSVIAFEQSTLSDMRWQTYGGPAILALAVLSLHFTGMAAMTIFPLAPHEGSLTVNDAEQILAYAVTVGTLIVLGIVAINNFIDRRRQAQLTARLRHLVESTVDGMLVEAGGRIIEANASVAAMTGSPREEMLDTTLDTWGLDGGALPDGTISRVSLRTRDGDSMPVEVVANGDADSTEQKGLRIYSIRDIRPRLEQERRIANLATSDLLTGLPNRVSFLDHIDRAITSHKEGYVALLAIDLNRFKEVNDVHGHAAGDQVLRVLSTRMRGAIREGEFVARLGGDEFVVVAHVWEQEHAMRLAKRIEAALDSPVPLDVVDVVCGGSIGIALYPYHASTATALMNNADVAMYRAKNTLAENVCFYEEQMDEAVRARRRIAADLRDALAVADRQFELHYQVQVAADTEIVTGYEALIRWRHPERGLIVPNDFIPIAEETGLIVPLGEWVLRTACAEAATWSYPHKVAINISVLQLAQGNLPAFVHQVLLETGLKASRLELETTESALMKDPQRSFHILRQLKALGVSIAIDDFGTGYSSLSTLRSFGFDKIKLDNSFMKGLEVDQQAREVMVAVLALGSALHIPVLAEGVETMEQLEFLRSRGCDEVQGFLFGRPTPLIGDAARTVAKKLARTTPKNV
ncbi:MAG: EAL domain-containing protein [Hyphomicrobium sp.]|uniref:bifunctional diguanylate cyclase/phosphodiesterase n=1 Tax=Hyphomicrobium sp. TaxID=82 RepID=UPI003D0E0B4B